MDLRVWDEITDLREDCIYRELFSIMNNQEQEDNGVFVEDGRTRGGGRNVNVSPKWHRLLAAAVFLCAVVVGGYGYWDLAQKIEEVSRGGVSEEDLSVVQVAVSQQLSEFRQDIRALKVSKGGGEGKLGGLEKIEERLSGMEEWARQFALYVQERTGGQ